MHGQKQIWPFFNVYDVIVTVTWKLLVLILVDMDRGNQALYIGTKYSIRAPLF